MYSWGHYICRAISLIFDIWINVWDMASKVLARLDRLYSFLSSIQNSSSRIIQYKIQGDSTFSDHHPVSFQINLSKNTPRGSLWKSNGRFLLEAWEPIKALWKMLPPHMAFFTKLRKVVKFCLAKATESRLEDSRLRQQLEFWQVILHSNTTNETTKAMIKIFREKIQSLSDEKEEGCRIRSRTRRMEFRDRMYKHIFSP